MIQNRFWVLCLSMFLSACGTTNHAPLATVPSVDLPRYMGTWYEVAKLPNRFQAMCVADTQAQYAIEGSTVSVINRCRKADGTWEEARGHAKIVEGSGNAKLRVSFFWPFYGDYWVLALDPDYRWVLVGEPSRKYAWILARTQTLDPALVNTLLTQAEQLGFDRHAFQMNTKR